MKRYHLYDTQAGRVIKSGVPWPRADGGPIEGLADHLLYLEILPPPQAPAFDVTKEVLGVTETLDLEARQVVRGWEIKARAVPPHVTAAQLRRWLLRAGLLPQVEAALAAMPAGQVREEALIQWEYSIVYERGHPLVAALGGILGLDTAAIDAAFVAAAQL